MSDKEHFRQRVWARFEESTGVARFPGPRGRIPNFVGAERAAERLRATPTWQTSNSVKSNPDSPQLPVRAAALSDGIVLFMAAPKLAKAEPFIAIDPTRIDVAPRKAASIKGAGVHGVPIGIERMPTIDLIVCGSVAVNASGARIGKGGGYSDLEFALGSEAGIITDDTVIVTTVHDIQIVDGALPETGHDFRVDLIVTPGDVIECKRARRPSGIIWDDLDEEKIESIPVLAAFSERRR